MNPRGRHNAIKQNALNTSPSFYDHQHINFPVLGVVLNVYVSDDPLNNSAKVRSNLRGSQAEARVLVINDGISTSWIIPNVAIMSHGSSGIDNYYEELPKPCSLNIDGTVFSSNLTNVDPTKLDGDLAVVEFIGGSINAPVMMGWWPHPNNRQDPMTLNASNFGYLKQAPRLFRRVNGTKITVTPKGSIFLDTNEANAKVKTGTAITRIPNDDGGDIQIDIKPTRALEINFNPPVPLPDTEPAVPQPNPPRGAPERSGLASTLSADKDFVTLVAGKIIQLIGQQENASILLGINTDQQAVRGNDFQATFNSLVSVINDFIKAFNTHSHIGSPSAEVPSNLFIETAGSMPASNLSNVVKLE